LIDVAIQSDVIIALASFAGLTIALIVMNDRIDDHLPKIELDSELQPAIRAALQGYDEGAKREKVEAIVKISTSKVRIDTETGLSSTIAFVAAMLSVVPLVSAIANSSVASAFNDLIYFVCAMFILGAIALNRFASRALKRMPKLETVLERQTQG
jgi:putative copper export protein